MDLRGIGRRLARLEPGVLLPLEWLLLGSHRLRPDERISLPLLAIVGPPRVGSTLLYQILARSLDAHYFSNLQYLFYKSPLAAIHLSRMVPGRRVAAFDSEYGYMRGLHAPSEAGEFWRYWFDLHLEEREVRPRAARLGHIGAVLDRVRRMGYSALLSSWNAHAFYLDFLVGRFEVACFLRLRRDPVATVLSIYRARTALQGKPDRWWSLRPRTALSLDELDPMVQSAVQVLATERRLDELARTHGDRILELEYGGLCRRPGATVEGIGRFLQEHGLPVSVSSKPGLPEAFPISSPDPDAEITKRARDALDSARRLLSDSGPGDR